MGEFWKDLLDCRQWDAHFPHVAGIAGQSGQGAVRCHLRRVRVSALPLSPATEIFAEHHAVQRCGDATVQSEPRELQLMCSTILLTAQAHSHAHRCALYDVATCCLGPSMSTSAESAGKHEQYACTAGWFQPRRYTGTKGSRHASLSG